MSTNILFVAAAVVTVCGGASAFIHWASPRLRQWRSEAVLHESLAKSDTDTSNAPAVAGRSAHDLLVEADARRDQKQYGEAITLYRRVLSMDHDSVLALYGIGEALNNIQEYSEALAQLDRAITIDPGLAVAWNSRGVALSGVGRHQDAIESYDRALQLDPSYAFAWNNKGAALMCLNRPDEALKAFKIACALNPKTPQLWANTAIAARKSGNKGQMLSALGKTLTTSFHRVRQPVQT